MATMSPETPARRAGRGQVWRSPGMLILYAMVVGIVAGLLFGEQARVVEPLGEMFIRLLVSAAVPLVAANLLAGLTGLADLDGLGRVGGRFLAYFMLTPSLAIGLGVAVMTVLSPGTGLALPVASDRKRVVWGKSGSIRVNVG